MAAHRADTHAETIHRCDGSAEARALAKNLVGLGAALPFFLTGAVAQILVDPGDQRAAQWGAEVGDLGGRQVLLLGQDLAVDFQNRGLGVVQQRADFGIQRAELRQQLAFTPPAICAACGAAVRPRPTATGLRW